MSHAMAMTDVRQQIDAMSEEDRFFASAYLQHLANGSDSERERHLAERLDRLEQGRGVDLDQLKSLHESLAANGL